MFQRAVQATEALLLSQRNVHFALASYSIPLHHMLQGDVLQTNWWNGLTQLDLELWEISLARFQSFSRGVFFVNVLLPLIGLAISENDCCWKFWLVKKCKYSLIKWQPSVISLTLIMLYVFSSMHAFEFLDACSRNNYVALIEYYSKLQKKFTAKWRVSSHSNEVQTLSLVQFFSNVFYRVEAIITFNISLKRNCGAL